MNLERFRIFGELYPRRRRVDGRFRFLLRLFVSKGEGLMEIRVVSDYETLRSYIPEWDDLATAVLEPNPFYEHWMLLPAIRHFSPGKNVQVAFLFQSDPAGTTRPPLLCGVFPLEKHRHYMSLPVSAWSLWKYNHCPLTTPMIRAGFARECMEALFGWLVSNSASCHLLELRHIAADGPFHQALVDQVRAIGSTPIISEVFTRALFKPMHNSEQYLSAALSAKSRSVFRRKAKQLSEMGRVDFAILPRGGTSDWIESFLRLERSGWKGQEGSAMACRDADRNFFVEVATEAYRKGRLLMPAMLLDGNPIAQHCYFLAGHGSFFFKPAFDEHHARFSPGFQLECEMIGQLHQMPEIAWMDSCTSPDNEMYNRLFLHRRTIQTMLVPVGKSARTIVVSAIPLLKSLKQTARSAFHFPSSPQTLVQAEKR